MKPSEHALLTLTANTCSSLLPWEQLLNDLQDLGHMENDCKMSNSTHSLTRKKARHYVSIIPATQKAEIETTQYTAGSTKKKKKKK
jgi:hypothetical protein